MLKFLLMSLPERGTPEWAATEYRINRRIMDTASNVAVRRKDLPAQVHVLIHDEVTGERFGSFVGIQYIGDSGMANITRTSIGMVAPGVPLTRIADTLLEHDPGTPLVCDNKVADELSLGSIPWIEEGHYRLEGRPGGVIEVYTHYEADRAPKSILPPGVASAQFYTE